MKTELGILGCLTGMVLIAVAVTGCNSDGTLTTKSQNVLNSAAQIGCVVDGVAQPLAVVVGGTVATAAGYGPEARLATDLDAGFHQQIQAGCAAMRGTMTSVPAAQ